MRAELNDLAFQDARAEGGALRVFARFGVDQHFSRNIEPPFSMKEVAKALYLLSTDILRAVLPSDPSDRKT